MWTLQHTYLLKVFDFVSTFVSAIIVNSCLDSDIQSYVFISFCGWLACNLISNDLFCMPMSFIIPSKSFQPVGWLHFNIELKALCELSQALVVRGPPSAAAANWFQKWDFIQWGSCTSLNFHPLDILCGFKIWQYVKIFIIFRYIKNILSKYIMSKNLLSENLLSKNLKSKNILSKNILSKNI